MRVGRISERPQLVTAQSWPSPRPPAGSGIKQGGARQAARHTGERAHRPRANPKARGRRGHIASHVSLRPFFARTRPQITKKKGPVFLGRVAPPPLPPPLKHPGRRAGLEVTPQDAAGGHPKSF